MIIADITATRWHHPVFKYHPIETTRFFIIWLEVNGTPPLAPGPRIGMHQVSAAMRISEPYLQLCHLMQNSAVAAEITRTLQHMMGNLHSPELMVYCPLSHNIFRPGLTSGSPSHIRKPLSCVKCFGLRGCSLKCVTQASCPLPRVRTLLPPPLSWQCHFSDRDMSEERGLSDFRSQADATSWGIRNPIMQIKSPTTRPMNGPLSQWISLHLTFHPRPHCYDSEDDGGDMSHVTMWDGVMVLTTCCQRVRWQCKKLN